VDSFGGNVAERTRALGKEEALHGAWLLASGRLRLCKGYGGG
jgi:hypothetical protein